MAKLFVLLLLLLLPCASLLVQANLVCKGSPPASDSWCDTNCNHDPPNCPPALCRCGIGPAPGPAPSPAPGPAPAPPPVVGAYHDMSKATGLQGLQTLAANALTLPI